MTSFGSLDDCFPSNSLPLGVFPGLVLPSACLLETARRWRFLAEANGEGPSAKFNKLSLSTGAVGVPNLVFPNPEKHKDNCELITSLVSIDPKHPYLAPQNLRVDFTLLLYPIWMGKTCLLSLWVPPLAYYGCRGSSNKLHAFFPSSPSSKICSLLTDRFAAKATAVLPVSTCVKFDSVDFNVAICRFCELGNLQKAVELLFQCQKLHLDVATYCSVLQLCADLKSLDIGKKVHSAIKNASGVGIGGILGSKLVFMYVCCGVLVEARKVFDGIFTDNVFTWNLLMNAYAKIGYFQESVRLYCRMLVMGVQANAYSFSCVLKCFAALRKMDKGKEVHASLLKLGFGSDTTVLNSLITFYFKFRRIENSQRLFDAMSVRDVVSWNSMISGFVANGLAGKGVETFVEMLSNGIGVDLSTMTIILAACADIDNILLSKAVHGYAIKAGFEKKLNFDNTLLDVYSKCGDMDGAVYVFENMVERSIVSWTSMIAGYAREGLFDKAFDLFRMMRNKRINPDAFAVTSILHACACTGLLENGMEVHDYVKEHKMESNLVVSNALIDMYTKCRSVGHAEAVFFKMKAKDIVSWNTMIGGYSKNGLANEALNMFIMMQRHFRPDDVTVTSILPACASLGALERGREIHTHLIKNDFSSDQLVANALVDMYVKCGALIMAKLIFDKIILKDIFSWTIMIAGYGMHGFGREAIATFREMRQSGIVPDGISFISILYACSHSGLLDEGWKLFHMMKNKFHIEPKMEHYASVVDLLARAGKLSMAYKFIKSMPLDPDANIWGLLLNGCRMHHDVQMAEEVVEYIFELEPENTSYYVLLASIYAEAEKWEEVLKLQHRIINRRWKKNTCCSWIEMKGEVYIFVSGNNKHPEARNIKFLMKDLEEQMEEDGHSTNKKYTLMNPHENQKQLSLCGHSEKLAMAFGILRSPPGKTIRVTKNIRVCGDCHEMGKFMSKKLGREIVLRDSHRFHRFKDGVCSCRGYW